MKKAYIVGIDDYSGHPLSGCVNDANVVSELLSHNADGSPNFDVKIGINVKKKFKEIRSASAGPETIVLCYQFFFD